MYEAQYRYIKRNPEKYRAYASERYYKDKANPEKAEHKRKVRELWYAANKQKVLEKQKETKRQRKNQAIEYLGGKCNHCQLSYHPAVFEFHHKNPAEKERDPSKMLNSSWDRLKAELDKCELLCANCHRLVHHNWES
jgi:hypothetical protein